MLIMYNGLNEKYPKIHPLVLYSLSNHLSSQRNGSQSFRNIREMLEYISTLDNINEHSTMFSYLLKGQFSID